MKLAVIGNGIIGSIVSSYLSSKGYSVDCIGPDLGDFNKYQGINIKNKICDSDNISPKFKRNDLLSCKIKSDNFFPKKDKELLLSRIRMRNGFSKILGRKSCI